MGKLFANLTTEGMAETEDRLGGGRQLFDTKVYDGTCKLAYAGESDKGAKFIRFLLELDGKEYEETIYFTNTSGENFYKDKSDGKKQQMPGFVTVNEFCLCAAGMELNDLDFEERPIEIWDATEGKKVRQARPVAVELVDVPVTVAIRKFLENKSVKNTTTNKYEDTAETREGNEIVKSFHPETRATVPEIKRSQQEGAPPLEAKFIEDWAAKYKPDYVMDKRTIKDGKGGASAGAPKSGAAAEKPKSSLFKKD